MHSLSDAARDGASRPIYVDLAEQALRTFGDDLTRDQAERLLSMWRYASALTEPEQEALLDRFGAQALPEDTHEPAEPADDTSAPWTVGELRRAIQDVPDDTPLRVNVADGDLVEEQVLGGAGFGKYQMGDDPPDVWHTCAEFGLDCDYPPGVRS